MPSTRLRDTDVADTSFRIKLGLPVFFMTWFVLRYLVVSDGISRTHYLVVMWLIAPGTAFVFSWLALGVIDRLSRGLLHSVFAMGGDAHTREFSEQEALVSQGRVGDAIDSYRSHLVAFPEDIEARLRLASLLAGQGGQPAAAERLWHEARRLPHTPRQATAISNGLIDLYRATDRTAALKDELARFARTYPGTRAGSEAHRLLRELVAAESVDTPREQT